MQKTMDSEVLVREKGQNIVYIEQLLYGERQDESHLECAMKHRVLPHVVMI